MLRQQRFAYYVAVPAALLCGYVVARAGGLAGRLAGRAFQRIARGAGAGSGGPRWLTFPVAAMVGAVLFAPSFTPAVIQASSASGPDAGWYDALVWMRKGTPPPLGAGDRYRARYLAGPGYRPPDTAYGVLATWDRGYWITRIARRIPNANPTQYGARDTARFLTTSRWREAEPILRKLGTRYVVVDDALPLRPGGPDDVTGELVAQAEWAGVSARDWVRRFETGDGVLLLYLPRYYRTMGTRLATFRGEAVTPDSSTVVVTYRPAGAGGGMPHATAVKRFATSEEAEEYRASLPGDNHVLGGTDPAASCVPLHALPGFRLVYESPDSPGRSRRMSRVRIFEVSAPGPARTRS